MVERVRMLVLTPGGLVGRPDGLAVTSRFTVAGRLDRRAGAIMFFVVRMAVATVIVGMVFMSLMVRTQENAPDTGV